MGFFPLILKLDVALQYLCFDNTGKISVMFEGECGVNLAPIPAGCSSFFSVYRKWKKGDLLQKYWKKIKIWFEVEIRRKEEASFPHLS